MNTDTPQATSYTTTKGMTRYRIECPTCGAKFAGKYYPLDAEKALRKHECK